MVRKVSFVSAEKAIGMRKVKHCEMWLDLRQWRKIDGALAI